jgi:plastocyanin
MVVAACSARSAPVSTGPGQQHEAKAPAVAAGAPVSSPGVTPREGQAGPKPNKVTETVQALREAADELEKANAALERGLRNIAEERFSVAELLASREALAAIAPLFREGAPPRITTPTRRFDPSAPPQPVASGSSEKEDDAAGVAAPRIRSGSLSGRLMIDGKAATAFGLITLEPTSGKWKRRSPKHAIIEQRGREFFPKLTAVAVGSTVSFPNFDSVFHNVFANSPSAAFDLGLYRGGEAREYTFEKEGIIRIGCNLHANMSAYIAVVAAPSYVVTDENGNFAFRRLTPGKYRLRAWSVRSKTPIEQTVTIKPGSNRIEVGVAGDAPEGPAPDKFGGKRG